MKHFFIVCVLFLPFVAYADVASKSYVDDGLNAKVSGIKINNTALTKDQDGNVNIPLGLKYENGKMSLTTDSNSASTNLNYFQVQNLPTGADLDDYTTNGIWATVASSVVGSLKNKPEGSWNAGECSLEVYKMGTDTLAEKYTYQEFIIKASKGFKRFARVRSNGVWYPWQEIAMVSDIESAKSKIRDGQSGTDFSDMWLE